jgi:hypothetical protein
MQAPILGDPLDALRCSRTGVSLDCVQRQAEAARAVRQPDSGLSQGMDLLPPLEGGLGKLSLAQSRGRGPARVAQAVPEMPSVGDLDRVRQRIPHGLCIGCRTVPAHDLDPWMRPQPTGHDLSAAPSQYVDPGTGKEAVCNVMARSTTYTPSPSQMGNYVTPQVGISRHHVSN